jgi:hypothetical protein
MTAHWAYRDENDGSIKIKARLIAFHKISGKHTGEKLGQLCMDLLDRAGTTANVSLFIIILFNSIDLMFIQSGHWTLDNASTNDAMLEVLKELFKDREITSFDAKDNRVICFPHTINIAVQHVLQKMSSADVPENDDDYPEDQTGVAKTGVAKTGMAKTGVAKTDENRRFRQQSFEDACAQDPIARLRKIIFTILSSGQRREAFAKWIETGNNSNLFVVNNRPVKIQPLQLLRDVRTRWDSTFQMIQRCIEMRLVIVFAPSLHNLNDYHLP